MALKQSQWRPYAGKRGIRNSNSYPSQQNTGPQWKRVRHHFFLDHCTQPSTHIRLHIVRTDLALSEISSSYFLTYLLETGKHAGSIASCKSYTLILSNPVKREKSAG